MIGKRCLHTEDSLHILGSRGAERASHHEDSRPRLDADTSGQTSATQCNCIGLVRIFTDGLVYHLQGFSILFVLIAIACNIDNLEHTEYRMCFQFGTQCTGRLHARHQPQCMSEDSTEGIVTIGIEAVFILLAKQREETVYVLVMNKGIVILGAEELAEVECFLVPHILTHQCA